jgi:hypothetical protein
MALLVGAKTLGCFYAYWAQKDPKVAAPPNSPTHKVLLDPFDVTSFIGIYWFHGGKNFWWTCSNRSQYGKESHLMSHISKIMFFATNGWPRWDAGRARMFHGKVGMWPIARQIPAARSSRNRAACTLEWKSHSLPKEAYTTLVFEKLVPAILKNWPRANTRVLIQQDNPPPQHITRAEFCVLWLKKKV